MKIAILSGKGGTGKTFISTNLTAATKKATYVDCDVEEPNGRIFLKPENNTEIPVLTMLPTFDKTQCIGCRKCVDFCHFNALVFLQGSPKVFKDVCHFCGGCEMVCPVKAVKRSYQEIGKVQLGEKGDFRVITGLLNIGEASGVPVIKKALELASHTQDTILIDCPPGSGCSVIESASCADVCIMVVEPTAFGFHNFKMIYRLVKVMDKRCYIIINKEDTPYLPLEDFCKENEITILGRIPFSKKIAKALSSGILLYGKEKSYTDLFDRLLYRLKNEVKK